MTEIKNEDYGRIGSSGIYSSVNRVGQMPGVKAGLQMKRVFNLFVMFLRIRKGTETIWYLIQFWKHWRI